ncbi:hypothetical protein [Propionibacterium ruminifibrarum]|uniref:hypothetical protein n=1 Tax=Propionibacterium ruminifibrarum TaxID=1962131 RepID=UPI0011C3DDB9|nr:hypothetical protein [Propionibacterium ruminifibrarum]
MPSPPYCRVLTAYTSPIAATLTEKVTTSDGLDPDTQLVIDDAFIPCWAWRDKPELNSAKHPATGVNLQVSRLP